VRESLFFLSSFFDFWIKASVSALRTHQTTVVGSDFPCQDRLLAQTTSSLGGLGAEEVTGHLMPAFDFAGFGQFDSTGDCFFGFLLGHGCLTWLGSKGRKRRIVASHA
jgi:hypothetical protein